MPEFFSFFVILFAAVLFSRLFSRMRVPWVVALIIGGVVIGPHGLELFETDRTIDFLANVGLVFLMFMAGLETRFSGTKGIIGKTATVAALSGIIPGITGIFIALLFGYSMPVAILLGIVFMSSSIALLVPNMEAHHLLKSALGKVILGGAIVVDAVSLILLSIFLQFNDPSFSPLVFLWYPVFILVLMGLAWALPRMRVVFKNPPEEEDLFERELRFIILMLVGLVVFFELIGLHAIIAGFFAGLILSRSIGSRILKAKLHAVGYGFFIPVFFVVLGANTNIGILVEALNTALLATVIVIGSIGSKILSGWIAGKLSGFNRAESIFLGVATIPSLSTTLAVAFLGFGAGIFDQALLVSIVFLSVTTSIIAPILTNILGEKLTSQQITLRGHEEEIVDTK